MRLIHPHRVHRRQSRERRSGGGIDADKVPGNVQSLNSAELPQDGTASLIRALGTRLSSVNIDDALADLAPPTPPDGSRPYPELYMMGFHFIPFTSTAGQLIYLPTMSGSGENEVTLYPNHVISIVMANAAALPAGERALTDAGPQTLRAVQRFAPF